MNAKDCKKKINKDKYFDMEGRTDDCSKIQHDPLKIR